MVECEKRNSLLTNACRTLNEKELNVMLLLRKKAAETVTCTCMRILAKHDWPVILAKVRQHETNLV